MSALRLRKVLVAWALASALGLAPGSLWAANAAPAGTQAVMPTASAKPVDEFMLKDISGKSVALHDYKDKSAVVVFFMGVDCPISNLYLKDLADLQARYAKQGVQIVGLQSNAGTTQARAAQHAKEYK